MKTELGLEVKPNYKEFKIDYVGNNGEHYGSPIDMMGYVVYRDYTIIRKTIFKKIRRSFLRGYKYTKKNRTIPLPLSRKIIYYYGWISNSDSETFKKKYKVVPVLNNAKKSISGTERRSVKNDLSRRRRSNLQTKRL